MSYPLSITKDEINLLPMYRYEGKVVVINTTQEAFKAIKELAGENLLGFDTETRAAFKKGESYDISLLQLATSTHSYLFRLSKFKMMPELTAILSNPDIIKAGVAVKDDIKGLKKILNFEDNNFVDLAQVAKEKEIQNFGLRALTAICLNKRLSKKEKISNWSQDKLTRSQLMYAASDAAVGFEIYQVLNA